MQDWEIIATEERAVRESLSDRVVELEENLTAQKEVYETMAIEYEKQGSSMNSLQNALQEIQEGMGCLIFRPDHSCLLFEPYSSEEGAQRNRRKHAGANIGPHFKMRDP